jgi:hypothetical protein
VIVKFINTQKGIAVKIDAAIKNLELVEKEKNEKMISLITSVPTIKHELQQSNLTITSEMLVR